MGDDITLSAQDEIAQLKAKVLDLKAKNKRQREEKAKLKDRLLDERRAAFIDFLTFPHPKDVAALAGDALHAMLVTNMEWASQAARNFPDASGLQEMADLVAQSYSHDSNCGAGGKIQRPLGYQRDYDCVQEYFASGVMARLTELALEEPLSPIGLDVQLLGAKRVWDLALLINGRIYVSERFEEIQRQALEEYYAKILTQRLDVDLHRKMKAAGLTDFNIQTLTDNDHRYNNISDLFGEWNCLGIEYAAAKSVPLSAGNTKMLRDMMERLRRHMSLLAWNMGMEMGEMAERSANNVVNNSKIIW